MRIEIEGWRRASRYSADEMVMVSFLFDSDDGSIIMQPIGDDRHFVFDADELKRVVDLMRDQSLKIA